MQKKATGQNNYPKPQIKQFFFGSLERFQCIQCRRKCQWPSPVTSNFCGVNPNTWGDKSGVRGKPVSWLASRQSGTSSTTSDYVNLRGEDLFSHRTESLVYPDRAADDPFSISRSPALAVGYRTESHRIPDSTSSLNCWYESVPWWLSFIPSKLTEGATAPLVQAMATSPMSR